jgi:hypothetical protein
VAASGSRRLALHIWWQRWDRVQKPIDSSNLSSPGLKMAQGGDASLLEAMERLKRENEALVKKCETLTLEKELDRLERDKIQTRFSTPGLETETPKPQSKLFIPGENVTTRKKTSLKPSASVKAATYDGQSSWRDYRAHFETCAEINQWDYNDKGLYLAVSLRGQAQGVLGNLAHNSRDFDSLLQALEERFAPPNQTELYRVQLRDRRQKASETLGELGQDIRRLNNLAYPSAPADLKETLAKDQFLDALQSADMRLRIKQVRPVSLNDAIRHAVELEAFYRAERTKPDRHVSAVGTDDNN